CFSAVREESLGSCTQSGRLCSAKVSLTGLPAWPLMVIAPCGGCPGGGSRKNPKLRRKLTPACFVPDQITYFDNTIYDEIRDRALLWSTQVDFRFGCS